MTLTDTQIIEALGWLRVQELNAWAENNPRCSIQAVLTVQDILLLEKAERRASRD